MGTGAGGSASKKVRGGGVKFDPYQQKTGGGGGKSLSHAEEGGGGWTKCVGVVLTWELEVLAILKGGVRSQSFDPLKGGGVNSFTLSCGARGGGGVTGPRFSPFVAPPPQ